MLHVRQWPQWWVTLKDPIGNTSWTRACNYIVDCCFRVFCKCKVNFFDILDWFAFFLFFSQMKLLLYLCFTQYKVYAENHSSLLKTKHVFQDWNVKSLPLGVKEFAYLRTCAKNSLWNCEIISVSDVIFKIISFWWRSEGFTNNSWFSKSLEDFSWTHNHSYMIACMYWQIKT